MVRKLMWQPFVLVTGNSISVMTQEGRWLGQNLPHVFEYLIFTLGHELAIPLRIREKLAERLRNEADTVGPLRRRGGETGLKTLDGHTRNRGQPQE
jgi:hypothetical protein